MTRNGTTTTIDPARVEAFGGQLLSIANGGALALMISIGHRTRLFDAMAELPPSTSEEIAAEAGLDERYVREWLGAMTTGRIVEHDPVTGRYVLPPEHAALTTRKAAPDNLALIMQYVGLLGTVEDRIVECFHRGGGVPYSAYGRFHEVMAEDSGQTVLAALESRILPLAPGLVERLESGIEVLDVGCGRGRAINLLARSFPASRFTGVDLSPDAIAYARAEARRHGSGNVVFETKDAAQLDHEARFDLVTAFDAIHDQADPAAVLANMRRALRGDGLFLMQDIKGCSHVHGNLDNPLAPLLYTISCMHCMTVSLARGGAGLGAMWGKERALGMLAEAGFSDVAVEELDHDLQNYYYLARP